MIPFINKKNKYGKLIPWDTSLVHLDSNSKLSLRATERTIEKSKILPAFISLDDVKDENNNPVKSNLVKKVFEESKKKRNQILIIQIKEVKKDLLLYFVNELIALSEEMYHHPEILIDHTKVTVTLYTRDLNDVTERDLSMSKKIDEIISNFNSNSKKFFNKVTFKNFVNDILAA